MQKKQNHDYDWRQPMTRDDVKRALALSFLQGKDAGYISAEALIDTIYDALTEVQDRYDQRTARLTAEVKALEYRLTETRNELERLQRIENARMTERDPVSLLN
jgi:multidrug efflux pump subunit AcrA (membrane-fusion protein)